MPNNNFFHTIAPIARITINDDAFLVGDGILKEVSVTLSENSRSTNCSFTCYDPGLTLGNKYFKMSFQSGGIQVPPDLLSDPDKDKTDLTPRKNNSANGSSVQDASLKPEVKAWLDTIAWSEGADYNVIFGGSTFSGYSDHPRQLITAGGYSSDAAGRYQFLSTTWDDDARAIGLKDFSPASQDQAAVYEFQKAGALSYAEAGLAGLEQCLERISYIWASLPPSRYGQPNHTLEEVRSYYSQMLAKYGGSGGSSTANETAKQPPGNQTSEVKETVSEVSIKGTEIVIELGFNNLDQLISYHFIHIKTNTSGLNNPITTFYGQSIRWLLTRKTKNTAYSNITLKDLAQKVCDNHGLSLDMDGDGVTYEHLDQTGITDYELLIRECRAIGYSISEDGNKLIIKPYSPNFTGFVITRDMLIDISFSDAASKDRSQSPGATTSDPDSIQGESKTALDRLTGQAISTNEQSSKAVGKDGSTVVTGSSNPAVRGTVKQSAANFALVAGGLGRIAVNGGVINNNVLPHAADDLVDQAVANIDENLITGLPNQPVGSVDLANGKAEAIPIKDESRRVKGYESRATIKTTPEALTLAPGSIIGISRSLVPETFATEWRIETVTHNLRPGKFTTELHFYKPQQQKAESSSTGGDSTTDKPQSTLDGQVSKEGWANPMKIEGNSSCGAICEYGYARGRLHEGLDHGGFGFGADPDGVFAASSGTVTRANNTPGAFGGYGRCVDITRDDGWMSRYAHLAQLDVTEGQKVTQGQRIGTRGSSGYADGDYAIHLHFEIRSPDGQSHNPRDYLPHPQIPIAGG